MHCPNCGAPIDAEAMAAGVCTYCQTAVPTEREPSLQHGLNEIFAALGTPAGSGGAVTHTTTVVESSTSFVIDGKTYARLEDMPPEVRKKMEAQMAKLAALGLTPGKR